MYCPGCSCILLFFTAKRKSSFVDLVSLIHIVLHLDTKKTISCTHLNSILDACVNEPIKVCTGQCVNKFSNKI